jgi:hypothetical protein
VRSAVEDAVAKAVAEVAARSQAHAGPLAITAPPPVHSAPTALTALAAPAAPATPAEEAGTEVSDGAKFAAFTGAKKKPGAGGPESKRAAATDKRCVPFVQGMTWPAGGACGRCGSALVWKRGRGTESYPRVCSACARASKFANSAGAEGKYLCYWQRAYCLTIGVPLGHSCFSSAICSSSLLIREEMLIGCNMFFRIKLAASGPLEKGTWAAAADGVELEPHGDGGAGDGGGGAGEGAEGAGIESGVSGEEREARRLVTAKLVSLVHR